MVFLKKINKILLFTNLIILNHYIELVIKKIGNY